MTINKKLLALSVVVTLFVALLTGVLSGCVSSPLTLAAEDYSIAAPTVGQMEIVLPKAPDGCEVAFVGSSNRNVIIAGDVDGRLKIFAPIQEVSVGLDFTISNNERSESFTKTVVVPAASGSEYTTNGAKNQMPTLIPKLREWQGSEGDFVPKNGMSIVFDSSYSSQFDDRAKLAVKNEIQGLTSLNISDKIGTADIVKNGDMFVTLVAGKGYLEQGYLIRIGDKITVEAENFQGVAMAEKTLLQLMKRNANYAIPKGTIRDYPQYLTRGLIIDATKRFYAIDTLKDIVRQMSFYKLNDLHLVLSGDEFRLQSSLAGLQSSQYYSTVEFADFREFAYNNGVTVVPEINVSDNAAKILSTDYYDDYVLAGDATKFNPSKMMETISVAEKLGAIFNPYYTNSPSAFSKDEKYGVLHIGGGGGYKHESAGLVYRTYLDETISWVQMNLSRGIVRLWSDENAPAESVLTEEDRGAYGEYVNPDKTQVNFVGGNAEIYFKQGYSVINTVSKKVTKNDIYSLQINVMGNTTYSAASMGLLGVALPMEYISGVEGASDATALLCLVDAMPALSEKTWNTNTSKGLASLESDAKDLGYAPNTANLEAVLKGLTLSGDAGVFIAIGVALGAFAVVVCVWVVFAARKKRKRNAAKKAHNI